MPASGVADSLIGVTWINRLSDRAEERVEGGIVVIRLNVWWKVEEAVA